MTQTDEQTLLAIVEQRPTPSQNSQRVTENFAFFVQKIEALGDDLVPLCSGLEKLTIVDMSLNRGHDDPQLIFESMNSTGLALSQADLIRNFVLMGLEPERQEQLYTQHWRPMELAFGQDAYSKHFDGFMRHYLTLRTGNIPKFGQVYEAFKAHALSQEAASNDLGSLLADLRKFADHYCALAFGRQVKPELVAALENLRDLDVDVAYPLLLELYDDYSIGNLSAGDLVEAVRLVESYLFRRAVCAIPTNSLNRNICNNRSGPQEGSVP